MLVMVIIVMIFIGVGIYVLGSSGDSLSCDDFQTTTTNTVYVPNGTFRGEDSVTYRDFFNKIYAPDKPLDNEACENQALSACGNTGQPDCDDTVPDDAPIRSCYTETVTTTDEWYDTCIANQNTAQSSWGIIVLIVIVVAAVAIIGVIRMLEIW